MAPADHRALSWLALAVAAGAVVGPGLRPWTGSVAGPYALFAAVVVTAFVLTRLGPRDP